MRKLKMMSCLALACAAVSVVMECVGAEFVGVGLAKADETSSLVVLGLRSLEGDDAQARALTDALRAEAEDVKGWSVLPRKVTIAQMSLAHGCDEPDGQCLSAIAYALKTKLLIFGTLSREQPDSADNFNVKLFLFNADFGRMSSSLTSKFRFTSREPQLRQQAEGFVEHLAGKRALGGLRVITNLAGAAVSINGETVGRTGESGEFRVSGLRSGTHHISVEADGYQQATGEVRITGRGQQEVRVNLREVGQGGASADPFSSELPQDAPSSKRWIGWTALGASAAFAGLTAYSWITIAGIADDADYVSYRNAAGPEVADVCEAANEGQLFGSGDDAQLRLDEVQSACSQANLLEVLQYVFIGGALAAGGVGAYFLLRSENDQAVPAERRAIRFTPKLSPQAVSLDARMSF